MYNARSEQTLLYVLRIAIHVFYVQRCTTAHLKDEQTELISVRQHKNKFYCVEGVHLIARLYYEITIVNPNQPYHQNSPCKFNFEYSC